MKHLITAFALCMASLSTTAFAAAHKEAPDMAKGASAPMGKQQSKMADCNKEAADKKGDDRKAFMKTCLSAKKTSQQDKMKACNADPKAKTTKGDERKAFMKECLSA
ncbi:MAG: phosphate starvation-inducible protein PsiF [Rhizobiales bacterium]|nr:phosphate starvation-inducible protein PsiF [Rhizobacter sp.]